MHFGLAHRLDISHTLLVRYRKAFFRLIKANKPNWLGQKVVGSGAVALSDKVDRCFPELSPNTASIALRACCGKGWRYRYRISSA